MRLPRPVYVPSRTVTVGGLLVGSEYPLPLPESASAEDPDVKVLAGSGAPGEPEGWSPLWPDASGAPTASVARTSGGFLVERRGGDVLRFPDDGEDLCVWPATDRQEYVAHLVLDVALPLSRSRRGEIVLHGAAIERRGRAVAILGDSGVGKSTAAAAWAAGGGRFLSDDWIVVEDAGSGFRVRPSHPSLRVSASTPAPDAARLHARFPLRESRGRRWLVVSEASGLFAPGPLGLDRIAVWRRVAGAGRAVVRRISSGEAIDALLRSYFSFELDSAALWAHVLPRMGALASSCEAIEVSVPDGPAGLEAGLALVAA